MTLALSTPNGVGLVGAHTYPQLEMTAKKQILDMIPAELIKNHDKKNNVLYLTNGYEVLFRSFDDEQKLRSLNLSHVWIEEANGTKFEVFTQLQTRLRHHATEKHKILMSTNPDSNWVKTEILLKADRIYGAKEKYHRDVEDKNQNIHVHIARTEMNTFLPSDYVETVSIGKPDYWKRKYLDGSFIQAEGMVYPNFDSCIDYETTYEQVVDNVKMRGWKVLGGSDWGINDPTTLILIAVDPVAGMVYVYDEYARNKVAVPTHARTMKERLAHVPLGGLQKLVGDPSGARRNINDKKSIFDHYAEYGLHFQKGDNRIDAGIMKVYSYIEMGKLRVLSSCAETIREHLNYRYKEAELGEQLDEKPVDKDNHLVDTLRYLIQELPDDPDNIKTVSYGYADLRQEESSQAHLPFELRTDEGSSYYNDWYNNY